jgi:hypothetical protein
VLLVLVQFHHNLAYAFQVLLFLGLLQLNLFLDHLAGERGPLEQDWEDQFADGALGEEEVVVRQDCRFVVLEELFKIRGQLAMTLLIL